MAGPEISPLVNSQAQCWLAANRGFNTPARRAPASCSRLRFACCPAAGLGSSQRRPPRRSVRSLGKNWGKLFRNPEKLGFTFNPDGCAEIHSAQVRRNLFRSIAPIDQFHCATTTNIWVTNRRSGRLGQGCYHGLGKTLGNL